jgi:uncharacterized protein YndB with AHSA1/START domain
MTLGTSGAIRNCMVAGMTDDQLQGRPSTAGSTPDDDTDPHVTRSVDLDASPAAVWDLLTDPERRGAWLDDEDAAERTMRIDTADPGRSLTWTWWRPDDETSASEVQVVLTELTDGSTRLAVTERLLAPPTTGPRSTLRASASAMPSSNPLWDYRLLGLELLVVMAGALVL